MKFLIDMNLSPRWTSLLQAEGWEAMHWSEAGEVNAPDSEILSFALANGYVLLTHDLDFGAVLAATGKSKPSVVQIRADDISPGRIGKQVAVALKLASRELEAGALLTIELDRTRLRLLPLKNRE